ncbi:MAG: hypothetical protein H0W73_11395 [Bacteroidetes bacterium]|nr:hypothetical protein [Bacteroidota bacterium]
MKIAPNIKIDGSANLPVNINEFFGKETIEKFAELFEQLQLPILLGTQMQINFRNLHNWVSVLDKAETASRKKYTFAEYIWYKIVEQLREAGLSLPIISKFKLGFLAPIKIKGLITKAQQAKNYIDDLKLTKEQKQQLVQFLASPEYKNTSENISFTLLDVIIVEAITKKLPLSISVFLNGDYMIQDKSKEHLYTEQDKNKLLFETYVTISVTSILNNFMRSDLSGFVVPKLGLLSYAENKLFEVVHSGQYESILINFKDKKIKSLELKKSEDIKQRMIDILNKDEFGEIVVKKHKGVVTKIENTLKITL